MLRPDLLAGLGLVLARPAPGSFGDAVLARAGELGADVTALDVDPFGDEPEFPGAAGALIWDGAAAFAQDSDATVEHVRACADGAWLATRAVANAALAPAGGGSVVLIAPQPGGAHHGAARAALENMARTLSIEWSRLGIRPVAIHPGAATTPETVAELAAFLCSRAGEYYSGTVLTLR